MLKKLFGFGKEKKEEQSIEQNEETKSGVSHEAAVTGSDDNLLLNDGWAEAVPNSGSNPAAKEPEPGPVNVPEDISTNDKTFAEDRITEKNASDETDFSERSISEHPVEFAEEAFAIAEEGDPKEVSDIENGTESKSEIGFFAKLKQGLAKTSQNFSKRINDLFSGYQKIDEEIYEELEELLILADLGFETAIGVTEMLRERAAEKKIEQVSELEQELEDIIEEILVSASEDMDENEGIPQIIVVVGVNGVGKTTSIGKLASQFKKEGKSVMLAAGDTFRAAASDQLSIWASRANVPIVRSNEGADPSAVIFDAIKSAQAKNIDVLICDTAGRLHNKTNLMQELEKVFRIVHREYPEAKKEVFLVIDATTGQNAVNQAKTFSEVTPLTGIILTKLDGTAKGGVVIGLSRELKVPIRYVGVGEGIEDLQKFSAKDFAKALFSRE